MSDSKKAAIIIKLNQYSDTLKDLLRQIKKIENDNLSDINDRLSKIKKIREEIEKVGTDIDKAKKELILINSYSVN